MNKKEDQDRADVYIKARVTKEFKEDFKKCCEFNGEDMTKVLLDFAKDYVISTNRKMLKK